MPAVERKGEMTVSVDGHRFTIAYGVTAAGRTQDPLTLKVIADRLNVTLPHLAKTVDNLEEMGITGPYNFTSESGETMFFPFRDKQ